ncbi:methionyl-tRNA formyltransferase [Bradyrhizobium sp.]|uniref:methionyl-tRNA formyltransferase n=1 Tax=Bradyrhizobium sp. TaxID=376 RepID=UPI003C77E6A8
MSIYALCTIGAGLDVLCVADVALSGIIGLTPRDRGGDAISGFVDASEYASLKGVPFIPVETYGLTSESDRKALSALNIDVLIVAGWQRLIPKWLIDSLNIGAIGFHGSANGISGGRGRSPQNWAIMLGAPRFSVSLFLIAPGIDDGPVIATGEYNLTSTDDIADSYRKMAITAGRMLAATLKNDPHLLKRTEQSEDAYYLPQRLPEDGEIDWAREPQQVLSFIRALTRPYPGAFSRVGERVVKVWRGQQYDLPGLPVAKPGTIRQRFADGALLIACQHGDVLVSDWSSNNSADIVGGLVLPSLRFETNIKRIVDRHRMRHPGLPIAKEILACLPRAI